MRQKNGMLMGIFSLVIAVIIVMGVMTPIISDWTTGEKIENDSAGWLRMSYTSPPTYYGIAAVLSEEGIVIYNNTDGTLEGTEILRGTEDTIIYADDNLALWYEEDTLFLLGQIDGEPIFVQRDDAISLMRESDGIRVFVAETPDVKFPFPTYAYEPHSDGNYAFFTNGTPVQTESERPNAIVGGGFAGVYAYNDLIRYDGLGLTMQTTVNEEGNLTGASWVRAAETEEEELGSLGNLLPTKWTNEKEPTVKEQGTEGSGGLKAVPTPDYTDGDWGYKVVSNYAWIVSYSGSGGGTITIPSTVGGYTVTHIGSGNSGETVFDTSITGTLVIPSTVTTLENYAFQGCSGLTGTLEIPSSVVYIGNSTFKGTGFTGSLVIPSSVETIFNSAFSGCNGLTSAYIPASVTSFNGYAFAYCTNLKSITFENGLTTIPINVCRESTGLREPIVIPASATSIGQNAFKGCTNVKDLVIVSDATPGTTSFDMSGLTEVLDLSDAIDYDTDRYGIPAAATVQDNIGDALGYISFTEIGSDPAISGAMATILITIPLVMIAGLVIGTISMMRARLI